MQVAIVFEPDEGGWHVFAPALKGVHSFGASKDEARANILEAIEVWLEGAIEQGNPILETETVEVATARTGQGNGGSNRIYKIPLVLEPQPEGGYTVTSPLLPGLATEGETLEEALHNVQDAFRATLEIYGDIGKPPPEALQLLPDNATIVLEHAVAAP
jgi:antitoxin HicB